MTEEQALVDQAVRFVREKSAKEIAALFNKHGFQPCRGFFYFLALSAQGKETPMCCGLMIVLIDVRAAMHAPLEIERLKSFGNDVRCADADIHAFVGGFDGDAEGFYLYHPDMYDKGKKVYQLSIQQRRTP